MDDKDNGYLICAEFKRENVSFDAYPFSLPVIKNLDRLEFHPRVTFFIGENGSGKSTLLEAVAAKCGFNPEGGSRNFTFSTADTNLALCDYLKIIRSARRPKDGYFLRAESFFNVATNIDELDKIQTRAAQIKYSYGGRSLHEQSHGEAFFSLFLNRMGGSGLYIFDEPEAALSPTRQLAFLNRLHELVRAGSQFIIATHSPIIMAYPDAVIYEFGSGGIKRVDYEKTDTYEVYRTFFADYRRFFYEIMK